MSKYKLLVFDWDDTFTLGATEGYKACYHAVVEELGLNLSKEEEHDRIVAKWGSTQEEEIKSLTDGFNVDQGLANKIYEENLFGLTFVDRLSLVPGAKELIESLSEKYTLAIATGLSGGLLREVIMPKFGISPNKFERIYSVYDLDDHEKAKPHPHMLEEIMSEFRFSTDETLMIGDAKNDVLMARAAGVEPVVVLTGHLSRQEAICLNVELILADVTELTKHL